MKAFDLGSQSFSELNEINKVDGSLKSQTEEDKLLHSVLESDEDELDKGRLVAETINRGISSFNPDMMFKTMVDNYKMAEKTYGETMIRQLTGYDPGYVRKNVNIPEFREQLKSNIQGNVDKLKEDNFIDKEGGITEEALELSAAVMYMEELDKLKLKGFGRKREEKRDVYGEKDAVKDFERDRYRDVAMKQSVKKALRRGHDSIIPEDLKSFDRKKRGKHVIIYAMDASGSMKGDKIGMAKKAGIALAYQAIQEKNEVGVLAFGSQIKEEIPPTSDFKRLLHALAQTRAGMETDIAGTIRKAVELFPKKNVSKHLMLITDALPTRGKEPVSETMEAVSLANGSNITISVLGIGLDDDGEDLAKKICEVGNGKLYKVKNVGDMDMMVLEDYYSFT